MQVRLGTRASALARWQADWVTAQLQQLNVDVELVPITTSGDVQQGPIGAGSAVGLFTKEIQRALLDDRIDLAVHSLKDLPTDEVPGLGLAAVPERAAVNDVLVSPRYSSLEELPDGSVVGTGSLRRRAQLRHMRPDLVMKDIRGNVDTRLRKLHAGDYDALLLAEAGLRRLGLAEHIKQVLPVSAILPAVGQGALGLETRDDDTSIQEVLNHLNDPATHAAVRAERSMLAALQGGCLAPIAAWGRVQDGTLTLCGRVISHDGTTQIGITLTGTPDDSIEIGRNVAQQLTTQGATKLVEESRDAS